MKPKAGTFLGFVLLVAAASAQTGLTFFDAEHQIDGGGVQFISLSSVAGDSTVTWTSPSGTTGSITTTVGIFGTGPVNAFGSERSVASEYSRTTETSTTEPADGTWSFTYNVVVNCESPCTPILRFHMPQGSVEDKELSLTFPTGTGGEFSGSFVWNQNLAPTSQTFSASSGPPDATDGSQFDSAQTRTYTLSTAAPEGMGAVVTDASDPSTIVVRMSLVPDDPDTTAQGNYSIERDTGSGYSQIRATVPGEASSGVISFEDSVSGTGDVSYRARLDYEITTGAGGFLSAYSCEVTISRHVLGDEETCGDLSPTGSGGTLFGPDGLFYGGDKTQYAQTWSLSETALDAFYGLGMVLFFAGLAFITTQNGGLAALGGVVGVIIALVFGLFPLWVIFFLVIVAGALLYARGGVSA